MSECDLLPIPPLETATDPAHSPADLRQRWRALMGPLGFDERLLRFAFMGPDRRLVKFLGDVELGTAPDRRVAENLMSAMGALLPDLAAGSTVALLLTRPGVGPVSRLDRRWAALLTDAARKFDVPIEPIFRAHDESLVQVRTSEQVPVRR